MRIGDALEIGVFLMPAHPPTRSLYDAAQWDLQVIRWAEELGYSEAWIGEHFTAPWEPVPSPDLLIAQALTQTERIRLGAGTFLLANHHPTELALRIAYLDQLSRGRLLVGVAPGGPGNDAATFGYDVASGENRRMYLESLNILLKYWTDREPWEYKGEFWTVRHVADNPTILAAHHLYPYQDPHPPVGMGGTSFRSGSLTYAVEHGLMPMSIMWSKHQLASHVLALADGEERATKPVAEIRADWRVTVDVFVADTDEEARRLAVDGPMGEFWNSYQLPVIKNVGFLDIVREDASVTADQIDSGFMADTQWAVGSPDTVADKIAEIIEITGGHGKILTVAHDYTENPEAFRHSMELFAQEVLPRLRARFADAELPDSFRAAVAS